MNILLSNSTDIFAGGEDYVLILAHYLQKRGHVVQVSANPGHLLLSKCAERNIGTIPIPYKGMSQVFHRARTLRAHLQQEGVDIVHSNANYDRTCAAMAAAYSRVRHVAGVHSAHSIQHNLTHWLRNRYGIDHFIADAEAVKSVLVQEDGIPESSISVIPIGVEGSSEAERARARTSTRTSLEVTEDTIIIGNVARLVPFKGHTHLLRAISEVVKKHTSVLFLIVGDGDLRSALEAQSKHLDIEQYVRFLGFRDNLHEIYPAFDVYCHSSIELAAEAFPLAILRALATGLPVVCTDVGGISLMVDSGKNGFLVQPEDPTALANALLRIIVHSEIRPLMGKASLQLFHSNFHASAMAEKVEAVYNSILSKER